MKSCVFCLLKSLLFIGAMLDLVRAACNHGLRIMLEADELRVVFLLGPDCKI